MKKFTIFALVMVLIFTFTACGRKNNTPTETKPVTTQPATEEMTLPTIDPTMGTNIPDPEVDSTMPDLMDPTSDANVGTSPSSPNITDDMPRSGYRNRK